MLPTTRATLTRLSACAALPLALFVALVAAYRGVAPLWAGGSSDPSYPYLLNSLMAAELHVPAKTDHPGITLELLGALTLRLWHAVSDRALPLRDHVLGDPEPFLAATVIALLLVFTASSVLLGWATWRLTGSSWLAVLAQASPFLCFEVLRSLVQVMVEPLLLAGAIVLSGLMLLSLLPETPGTGRRLAVPMGIVLGLALATKIVFLPAAVPLLAAGRSRRDRNLILLWSALAFGACLLLVAPRVPATAAWMWRLFAHSGYHGVGATTVIDPARYAGGVARLLRSEFPLHAAFVTFSVVCLWPRPPRGFHSAARRLALGLVAAWAVTLAAAAKQPQAHYLVTIAGLLPALLVLALWRLRLSGHGRTVWVARAAVAIVLAAGLVHAVRGGAWLMRIRKDAKAGAAAVAAAGDAHGPARVYGHRASILPAALADGNESADLAFSADLRRLYPQFLALDCEGLHAFGENVTARDVRAHVKEDGTVFIQDAAWRRLEDCPWTGALPRKTILSSGRDSLHEARILPPPADSGPWVGGMLVVAGMEAAGGPQRWATGKRTSLLFLHTGGPVTLELAAGHGLPGEQALSVFANDIHVGRWALPRLPATERILLPIQARAGWNGIEIRYDAVVPAAPRVETALLGFRTRVRDAVTPAVLFDTLRLVDSR